MIEKDQKKKKWYRTSDIYLHIALITNHNIPFLLAITFYVVDILFEFMLVFHRK